MAFIYYRTGHPISELGFLLYIIHTVLMHMLAHAEAVEFYNYNDFFNYYNIIIILQDRHEIEIEITCPLSWPWDTHVNLSKVIALLFS